MKIKGAAYCSERPCTSLTHSFCSLSVKWVTLIGGTVLSRYNTCDPEGSSKENLQTKRDKLLMD